MGAVLGDGRPFRLGRLGGPAPAIVASEVLDAPMGVMERRAVWQRVGVLPALTVVAGLFADLDLAAITDTRTVVEREFIAGRLGRLEAPLLLRMSQGRMIFSNVGLVSCLKEIIQYADERSDADLSVMDLTRCVLGVNQEMDSVDAAMMVRATSPDTVDIGALEADADQLSLDWIAQGLFDYTDTLETLACSVQEIWRSGWAPGTQQKVIDDLAASLPDETVELRFTTDESFDFVAFSHNGDSPALLTLTEILLPGRTVQRAVQLVEEGWVFGL